MNQPSPGGESSPPKKYERDVNRLGTWLQIRGPLATTGSLLLGGACILVALGVWWFLTWGDPPETRLIGPLSLPSPAETFAELGNLVFDRELDVNTLVTLKRVTLGFALAFVVGAPLGILAGCFAPIRAFMAPLVIFGRNIPLAALIPLTFVFFGIGETQKVIFIFIACVAFIISDTATAIGDVGQQYIDTAYTLGASRFQVIWKVLTPLAMPAVFNSARVLFGLAFGYIMLAEMVKLGNDAGGLGNLILNSQKRNMPTHIILIILIIPVVAVAIDQFLYWVQRELFPYRYGGYGLLHRAMRWVGYRIDDLRSSIFPPRPPFDRLTPAQAEPPGENA